MTASNGYHEVDTAYERSFEAYSRRLPVPLKPRTGTRSCGCSQNFTLRLRCVDCPAAER
jgi:hypothetical protein